MEEQGTGFRANKSLIFIIISILLAFTFSYLFIWNLPGIAVLLFTALILFIIVVLSKIFNKKITYEIIALGILALFFSGMVAIRSNDLLVALDIVATILLLMLITEVHSRKPLKDFFPFDYLKVLSLPALYLPQFTKTISSVHIPFRGDMDNDSKQIARGVMIALPIVIFFTVLFAGADPTFNGFLTNVMNIHFAFPDHIYITIVAFVLICGAYGYTFAKSVPVSIESKKLKYSMGHIETSIILGSVNALFLLFFILQATYIFGGVANITNDSFTYAEYARRGFFELIAISACTYVILLVSEKLIERRAELHSSSFKYLSAALVAQVMLLMVFAFNRLSLYESVYGFTTLRLYSNTFILLLAAVYLLLLYKIFIDSRENIFAKRCFLAIAAFLACMNILNPDAFIAHMNLNRYEVTGKIDYAYVSSLSYDAEPQLVAFFENRSTVDRSLIGRMLYYAPIPSSDIWQSWNWSREESTKLLEVHQAEFASYKDYSLDSQDGDTQ